MIQSPNVEQTWRVGRGLAAAAIAILLLEAVAAGSSRSCMPSFNLNILAGQIILSTVFGAPAFAIVGIAAFICAAAPSLISPRSWLAVAGALVAAAALVLTGPRRKSVLDKRQAQHLSPNSSMFFTRRSAST